MQAPVSVGQVIRDKYRVDKILGSGAMSVVALAYHLELEQYVALKLLQVPGLDPEDCTQRFRREARAGARIRSEHAARVIDVGTLESGCPYIVMEYLEGNDLADEFARRGPLSVAEISDYVLQAIDALAEAHAAGIVHRDIKPENLFLAMRPDGTRILKVLDFGISKSIITDSIADLALTRTASFVGSPLYMSPEQMRSSRTVDFRTDIWALGAILYEAVSGRLPYVADSIPELCMSLLQDTPPPLSQLRSDLPPGFEAVVKRCLEKDREARFASVAQLASALTPFAQGSVIYAERASRILTLASSLPPAAPGSGTSIRPVIVPSRSTGIPSESGDSSDRTLPSWGKVESSPLRRHPAALFGVAGIALVALGWAVGTPARDTPTSSGAPQLSAYPAAMSAPAMQDGSTPVPGLAAKSDSAPNPYPVASSSETAMPARSAKLSARQPRAAVRHPVANSAVTTQTTVAQSNRAAATARKAASAPPEAARVNAWDPAAFGGRH